MSQDKLVGEVGVVSDADILTRAKATFERMSPGWKALYKRVQARDLGRDEMLLT